MRRRLHSSHHGSHPGVLIWTDAFGLRPSMRDIGKRIAAEGYTRAGPQSVLSRQTKAPAVDNIAAFNFQTDMAKIQPLMASVNAPGAEKDAVAFIAWLDQQKQVNKSKKIGTQGYCMGGPLVVRTCAAMPDRVGAGGSFHGGGLVTDKPDSPHLLAPKIKARMYFGIATNDDMRQPDAKDKLKRGFRRRAHSRGDRSLPSQARLVRVGHALRRARPDLQHDRRRARLGQARRPVQGRPSLIRQGCTAAPGCATAL